MATRYTKAELASYAWEVRLDAVLLTRLAIEDGESKLVRQRSARLTAGVALRARTMLDRDTVGTFGRSDSVLRQRSLTPELADGLTCPDADLAFQLDAQSELGPLAEILASGATQRDAAHILGVSQSTVRNKVARCRKILENGNTQDRPLPDVTCEVVNLTAEVISEPRGNL